ncbi:sulfatase family protein [Flavihumibacter sp. UBA7668]|uniref:sulfatase family protein n=1 Tax=Flavihumibacter sp. UBA7668 TaxID=1946542 RepID=UPI0025B98AB9|nr:arylsulfatase [Flavihumibacter sp. UBA7668]
MPKINTHLFRLFLIGFLPMVACQTPEPQQPNIILFYVDDLGYGDLGCYGSPAAVTPFIDSLSKTGIRFTDAHSPAATCTPSRYSLLTGEYAFRNNAAILPGDAPLLIKEGKPTLPALLKKAGYATGVVGKWHLGLGNGKVNWNEEVKPGPLEIGFDYSFLLPSTGDRVPSVYLENHRVVNANPTDPIEVSYTQKLDGYPNGIDSPQLRRQAADLQHSNTIVNGISRIGYMKGGKEALWRDEDFPRVFTEKAGKFMKENQEKPFFLFFSFHDIHVPRLPNEEFQGKSAMGARGDAIMQMDWTVQQVIAQLKALNLEKETIIIFTSDNGPVLDDGYEDQAIELLGSHKPAGPYRGGKYSAFEAGTRVPLIITWPGKIEAQTSAALVTQIDLYRSLARLIGIPVPENEAIDSEDQWAAFSGKTKQGRDWMLEEAYTLSIRNANWKYIAPHDQNKKLPDFMANKGIESGVAHEPQLFDLSKDPGEVSNLATAEPVRVQEMQAKIDEIKTKTAN